ncbi:MAG TPA: hypothetical protein DCR40_16650 [Prolixibacteraceae bacterium]|nr:hypothetical protein [Prolixibacteraceae bacterium]
MKRLTYLIVILLLAANSFAQGHFDVAFSGAGHDHMTIYVVNATIGGVALEAGDEIAVFDGSVCAGKAILTQSIVMTNKSTFARVAASQKDNGLANGFNVGNDITFKFWDSSQNKELSGITAEFLNPSTGQPTTAPTFTARETVFVKLSVAAPANQVPSSNAGSDQSVNEGATVTLDGSASSDPDGNPLTYKWTAPAGITLSSNTVVNPTFTAPEVTINTSYTITLVVNDGLADSPADQVVITVKNVPNQIPVANAGSDQAVNEGATVTLDGSASSDPDGNPLTYQWTAPAGISLNSTTEAKPTFTASEVTINTSYTITLVVNDGVADSPADEVVITVKNVLNGTPVANAGSDQAVNEGATVSLDGSASSDPDGNPLTYKWTAPAGITLSSNTVVNPTFTAPEVTINTSYTITLVVNDGLADSPADQVVITVKQVNKAPVANAGANQTVNKGVLVTLDGTGSTDPDGNPLTYLWTAPAGITLSSATTDKPTFTAPEVTADADFTFSLVVNDGTANSAPDEVVVTVLQVNKAPVANAGPDQTVNEGAIVSLDGSTSSDPDGNPLTYKWTAPAGISLSSTTVAKPTFTAPEVTINTSYTLSLIVNDGLADSPTDQVVITVKQVNKLPVANAGANQSVNEGVLVTLDGTGSSDPDGNPLTYLWTAPAGITLSSTTANKPTFTAPDVAADTDYTFSLVVNDGTANSTPDEVKITVKQGNQAPVACAGPDQTVNEGSLVTLDGSCSYDPDNRMAFSWSIPGNPQLSSPLGIKVTVTGPALTTTTNYNFSLALLDGLGGSSSQINWTVPSGVTFSSTTVSFIKITPPNSGNSNYSFTVKVFDGSDLSDPNHNGMTYFEIPPTDFIMNPTTIIQMNITAPEATPLTDQTFLIEVSDATNYPAAGTIFMTQTFKMPAGITLGKTTVAMLTIVSPDGTNPDYRFTFEFNNGLGIFDPATSGLTYRWTAPPGIILSSETNPKPTFTAPEVSSDTDFTFTLVVNDGIADSPPDQVVVKVLHVNKAPSASASADQSANEGATVTLDGSASSDPDGDALTYLWSASGGIVLSSTTAAKPTFTAPEINTDLDYTFSLVVNDGTVNSTPDVVKITVKQVNKAPVANAGDDQSVNEGVLVTLDGTGSSDMDGNPLTYSWTAPAGITLSSTTADKPTFTAPEVSSDTNYSFSLVVNDGTANSAPDDVVITVKQVNKAPVANAGANQSVNKGLLVTLDGTASTDPDGNPLTYLWTAPAGITLSSATADKPTFTSPEVAADTDYTFSLVVNDGTVNSAADEVIVTVKKVNQAPVANAGANQSVNEGVLVTLDGTGSSDPDGNPLTYFWTAPAGITLSSSTAAKPTFTAPEVTSDTDYSFSLIVNDGTVNSAPDEMVVTVKNVDKAPYVKDPIKNVSVDKGAPDQIIDLKTVFADDDFGDVLIYSVISNTNDLVVEAKITGSNLTLDFSSVNIGLSEIVVTASSNGKEVNSKFTVEVNIPTGIIPGINDPDVSIYPNPTKEKIYLKFSQLPKTGTCVTVYTHTGIMISKHLADRQEDFIDMKNLPSGLYLIKIDQSISKTYKVVLE